MTEEDLHWNRRMLLMAINFEVILFIFVGNLLDFGAVNANVS